MKILIDFLHPAHVHVLRNFVKEMKERGHMVFITAREKDLAIPLLKEYGFDYIKISKIKPGKFGLLFEFIERNIKFYKICKKLKPDLLMGLMGPTIATVGSLLKIPRYTFFDTETAKLTNRFAYPLSTAVLTPSCYTGKVRGRHVTYEGYHELAYLHPSRFTPDPKVIKKIGLSPKDTYFVLRLVSWQASHDIGWRGFTDIDNFVKKLEKIGRVLITSESPLPKKLEKYRINLSANEIHHLMAFATMYIGESVTMASEAAVLGVPAILVVQYGISYTDEEEAKYGLVYRFSEQEDAFTKALELLKDKDLKKKWQKKREKMLNDKIDVTNFFVDFIENEYSKF